VSIARVMKYEIGECLSMG